MNRYALIRSRFGNCLPALKTAAAHAFLISLFLVILQSGLFAASNQQPFAISHGPYLQCMDTNSVTINWITNKDSIGWVELAPNDGRNFYNKAQTRIYDSHDGLKSISTFHSTRLDGLKPGTKYCYRICSQEVLDHSGSTVLYGDSVGTNVYSRPPLTFRTPDFSSAGTSFAMINDIHGHNNIMQSLLKQVSWPSTDFIMFSGDMVGNAMYSESQIFEDFMDTAVSVFAGETPMFYARGNHEDRGPIASTFSKYFPYPDGHAYYIFRRGPVCFIVLDSGEDKPDSDIEYSGICDFDRYRTEEAAWLKDALKKDICRSAQYRVAIIHIPPTDSWYGSKEVARLFVPLLNDAKVDVMLCGHMHAYSRVGEEKDIRNFPVIINSNDTILFGETKSDGMHFSVKGVDGKSVDEFTISQRVKEKGKLMGSGHIILGGGGEAQPLHELLARSIGGGRLLNIPIAADTADYSPYDTWIKEVYQPLGIKDIDTWSSFPTADKKVDLSKYSAIYIGGGNTYKLLHDIRTSGFDQRLKEYLAQGGYVMGCSAGSIILGTDIQPCAHLDNNDIGLTDTTGLNFVGGYAVWCHYVPENDTLVQNFMAKYHCPVLAIMDRGGIYVEGDHIRACGSDPSYRFIGDRKEILNLGDELFIGK